MCKEAVEERSGKIERVWRRSVIAESEERQYVYYLYYLYSIHYYLYSIHNIYILCSGACKGDHYGGENKQSKW